MEEIYSTYKFEQINEYFLIYTYKSDKINWY